MFESNQTDAQASTRSAASSPRREEVRHMLFGSRAAVVRTIQILHTYGYADPNDWCKPIPTGKANEFMAILTKPMLMA